MSISYRYVITKLQICPYAQCLILPNISGKSKAGSEVITAYLFILITG